MNESNESIIINQSISSVEELGLRVHEIVALVEETNLTPDQRAVEGPAYSLVGPRV